MAVARNTWQLQEITFNAYLEKEKEKEKEKSQ